MLRRAAAAILSLRSLVCTFVLANGLEERAIEQQTEVFMMRQEDSIGKKGKCHRRGKSVGSNPIAPESE